jgi:hypothetical protein
MNRFGGYRGGRLDSEQELHGRIGRFTSATSILNFETIDLRASAHRFALSARSLRAPVSRGGGRRRGFLIARIVFAASETNCSSDQNVCSAAADATEHPANVSTFAHGLRMFDVFPRASEISLTPAPFAHHGWRIGKFTAARVLGSIAGIGRRT